MKSIRFFLIIATLATLVLVVFVSAVQGFQSSLREAEKLFDGQLRELAHFAVNLRGGESLNAEPNAHIAYQLWRQSANGEQQLVAHTDNIPAAIVSPLRQGFGYANFSGYRWRTYIHIPEESELLVLAAARTDIRYQLAENVITEAILPIVIWLPLSGLLIWLVVGRGLRPLKELSEQLLSKQSRDLSPIRLPNQPAELDKVVHSVNFLLQRLQAAFEREKSFAADAAHELRTPISALKIQIHNLEEKFPVHSQELDQARHGIERMQHLVEQILALNKIAPEHYSPSFQIIDLYTLVQAVIANQYPSFEEKRQRVELTANHGDGGLSALLEGDRFALETLVLNLLTNANKYTSEGGVIAVDVSASTNGVTLRVEDNGPGIPVNQRERIFERFHRLGGDRHSSGENGCGLGLAIVKNIAELHGAAILVSDSNLGGACFTLTFPPVKGASPQ